jgi:tetratricopeptide (TPR) repeat protein
MVEVLSPNKLVIDGTTAYKRGDYSAAAQLFSSACQGYQAAGESLKAAEMANNSSVAYLLAGDAQASLQAVEGTPGLFAAAGDGQRQGMALGNQAAALEALGRLDEAMEVYQQ